jgi:nicotinamide-nucleotide amidase
VNEAVPLVRVLIERGQTLAVVESLTGGLLAATLVEIAGVSAVFRGGLVVYATDLKASLGGVPPDLLAARGPVDPDVAVAMAEGGRARCGADWALATTGVAGPDPQVRRLSLPGDRAVVRAGAVTAALDLLAEKLRTAARPA